MAHTSSRVPFALHYLLLGGLAAATLTLVTPAHADESSSRRDDTDEGSHESRRDRDNTKTHIAVDFDYNNTIAQTDSRAGGGGAVRLGQELDLFLVSLTPELGGSYHAFSGDADQRVYAGFLGGRFAVGKIVEPSIFGHLGVAHTSGFESRTAPILDAGLAVDFTLLPLIDLGLHGAYNVMLPRDNGSSLKFLTLGAQAALVL